MTKVKLLLRYLFRTQLLFANIVILTIIVLFMSTVSCVGNMETQNDYLNNSTIRINEVAQRYMDANGDEFIETL